MPSDHAFTYIVPFRSDFVRQPGSDFGRIDIAEIGGRSHVGDDSLDRVFCDPADIVGNSAMFVSKDQAFGGRGISRWDMHFIVIATVGPSPRQFGPKEARFQQVGS